MYFLSAVLIFILIPGAYALRLARSNVRHTTLKRAWWWWVASGLVFSLAVLVTAQNEARGVADQLWYLSSVLLICPWICALGARRPGDVAWMFFVIIPLVLVLEWPAISMMMTSDMNEPLVLQTPAVIGVFLVLIMGAGNYLGTRFTWSSLLFGSAVICFVLSVCEIRPARLTGMQLRYIGCGTLALAIAWTIAALLRWTTSEVGFGRVWSDFRDSFGIVWSRRVAERFNLMAKREKLRMRIRIDGPVNENEPVELQKMDSAELLKCRNPTAVGGRREEQILRWIMRRFVDVEWLNSRFGCSSERFDPTIDL